jgi:phosphate transport system permease protein
MTDFKPRSVIREAVERRLAKRYRSELRFRSAGLAAIVISVVILVLLLGSIARDGLPAFTAHQLHLTVQLDRDLVDPEGDGSEASLRQGSYSRVLQNAMRAQFPEVRARRDLRALFQLYTTLNSTRLMSEVLADPQLVGTEHLFVMPISDDLDLYLKHDLVDDRTLPTRGTVGLELDDDEILLNSTEADFAGILAEFRQLLTDEANSMQALASQIETQLASADDGETDQLRTRAERYRSQAGALVEQADAVDGLFELTDDMPSVILELAGGAVQLSALATDGHGATGRLALPMDGASEVADWTLYVVDTPAGRRRLSDNEIIWTRALVDRGLVRPGFNTYLFTNADSREPELAGVKGALFGSILTMIITLALSMPIGVFAAVYLEEYAPKNRVTDMIEVNINNLAAVPSIVFGLLGLAVFINVFGLPRSAPVLGGLVLSLMTLPTVIIATRAALKAVPPSIRDAALGVGASQTQAVFHHVLPLAAPGILTGSIIGLARAMGETAPLLMIGMVAFIADAPTLGLDGFTEPATVMPVQIFLWYDGAERAFEARTAAAILILLALMIGFNGLAVYLRRKFERRW